MVIVIVIIVTALLCGTYALGHADGRFAEKGDEEFRKMDSLIQRIKSANRTQGS
jgi:hypothetical protein